MAVIKQLGTRNYKLVCSTEEIKGSKLREIQAINVVILKPKRKRIPSLKTFEEVLSNHIKNFKRK